MSDDIMFAGNFIMRRQNLHGNDYMNYNNIVYLLFKILQHTLLMFSLYIVTYIIIQVSACTVSIPQ